MPKIIREKTALEVGRLKEPGLHAVGGVQSLCLQVTKNGARSWIYRTLVDGRRRHLGLGSYPTVTLKMARELARDAYMKIRRGEDPAPTKAITFAEGMEKFLAIKLQEFDNAKHRAQWRATLDTYAAPVISHRPIDEINMRDVLKVLEPIWREKTETASRLRGRVEAVLSWATVAGHREGENPARWKGNLDQVLPKPSKIAKVEHHKALALADVAPWWEDLQTRGGVGAKALAFLTLTAARSGEVRGATWAEIDLEARVWAIPAERMKMGKEHRVPLSDAALALLQDMPRDGDLVFANASGKALSENGMSALLKRQGASHTAHGMRSTFRDWAAERGVDRDLAEIALAHQVGSDVERAYRRSDMLERRRAVMDDWAAFLQGRETVGNVVPMARAK